MRPDWAHLFLSVLPALPLDAGKQEEQVAGGMPLVECPCIMSAQQLCAAAGLIALPLDAFVAPVATCGHLLRLSHLCSS